MTSEPSAAGDGGQTEIARAFEERGLYLTALTGIRGVVEAVLDEPTGAEEQLGAELHDIDDRRRTAAGMLRVLLGHLDREGSWEYQHVSALEEPLREILGVLTGDRDVAGAIAGEPYQPRHLGALIDEQRARREAREGGDGR